jgi:hypothetical protein
LDRLIYEQLIIANMQLQGMRRLLAIVALVLLFFLFKSLDIPWAALGIWTDRMMGISVG